MLFNIKELTKLTNTTRGLVNGHFEPIRPCQLTGLGGLKDRIRSAWLVFGGKADAVVWPEGQ